MNLYDQEGEPVDLDAVQRIRMVCFKCEKYIERKWAILIGPEERFWSDEVRENKTICLCEPCYEQVMVFCGAEPK